MSGSLRAFVARELARPVPPEVAAAGREIGRRLGGAAVLFYGSVLRTGDLDGLLDFYVLTARGQGGRPALVRRLWPDISFEEVAAGGRTLRAKVATMPLETFEKAASGCLLDTTIWTRFVQPSALVWARDDEVAARVSEAVAAAARTAARFAAVLGPAEGPPLAYWKALFAETYRAELRVERPGREDSILAHDPGRYELLLRLAWEAEGIAFADREGQLRPELPAAARRAVLARWRRRRRAGRPLNIARLVKAALLLDGAARYGAWKVERHTGVKVELTPWRERHPLLAAPGVLWRVWRARRAP